MAGREHDGSPNPDPFPDPQNQVAPQEPHKENDERRKGILKHARTYSNKHVDFNMDLEFVPFDETKDFTIEIQIVEKMPPKIVSYAALFAEQKAQEEAEERKKQEENKVKCKKVPNTHSKKGSCKSKKCKLASNRVEGSEGINGTAHSTDSFDEKVEISHNQEEDLCQCESNSQEEENTIHDCKDVDCSVNSFQSPLLDLSEENPLSKINETTIDTKSYETNSEEENASIIDCSKTELELVEGDNSFKPTISDKNEYLHNGSVPIIEPPGTENSNHECPKFEESLIKQERIKAIIDEETADINTNGTNNQIHLAELPEEVSEQSPNTAESQAQKHDDSSTNLEGRLVNNGEVNSFIQPVINIEKLEDSLHSKVGYNKTELGSTKIEQGGELQIESQGLNPNEIKKAEDIPKTQTISFELRPVEASYQINEGTAEKFEAELKNENHLTSSMIGTIVGNNKNISIEIKDDNDESIQILETDVSKINSLERVTPDELTIAKKENENGENSQNQLQNISIHHGLTSENQSSSQCFSHISNGENVLKISNVTTRCPSCAKEEQTDAGLNSQREAEDYSKNMSVEVVNGIVKHFEDEGGHLIENNYPVEDVFAKENIRIKSKNIGDIIETEKTFYESKVGAEIDEKRECILS